MLSSVTVRATGPNSVSLEKLNIASLAVLALGLGEARLEQGGAVGYQNSLKDGRKA